MKLIITESHRDKLINIIQSQIDSEMSNLKKLSDEDELSFDEYMEVESIVGISVVGIERTDKWMITVDIYKNYPRNSFDNVLYHLSYQLRDYIGDNEIVEGEIIDDRTTGLGIDW